MKLAMRFVLLALVLIPLQAYAQSSAPSLDDLGWLVGRWTAELDGGQVAEEVTTPAAGGAIVSTFRVTKGDATVTLELVVYTMTEDGLEMRFRHFSADLKPWEEAPIVMRLASREGNDWHFVNTGKGGPRRSLLRLQEDGRMYFRAELEGPSGMKVLEITMQKVG